ncbi:MAG: glycosyltransferase family 2 protein [Burkholderiaceae bacterium]
MTAWPATRTRLSTDDADDRQDAACAPPLPITMITPVFNGARTIEQTIASVREQRVAGLQYIVVDALSTDDTPQIVARHRDLITDYVREKDRGLYDAMNKGIARATGQIVGIINADDMLEPGALHRVADAFARTGADYVCSDLAIIDEDGRPVRVQRAETRWIDGQRHWLGRDWRMNIGLPHPTLFVRRSVYERLGTYDLSFPLAADHDFVARLISSGQRGTHVDQPLARFRLGGLSSSRLLECFREDERIARKHGLHPWLARLIRLRKSQYARRAMASR